MVCLSIASFRRWRSRARSSPRLSGKLKSQTGWIHGRRAGPLSGGRMDKPRIFLGSSGQQEKLLQALTRGLEDVAHVEPWTTSFNPGTSTLERLLELTHEVDFAAFVLARDDWTTNRPPASDSTGSGHAFP